MIRRVIFLVCSLCIICPPTLAGAQDAVADADLKALTEKAAKPADVEKLRQEILNFQQRYPGTTQAVGAAGLLRDLPSPLDKLEAKAVPAIEKFDWHPKETVAILGEHRGRQGGAGTAVAWSKNGKLLASTSTNGYVRIWDPATMRLLHTLGHSYGAYSVLFSKDNTLLAHGGGDGQVRMWEVSADKPKEKGTYKVASTPILGLALAPNNKWFVAGSSDSRIYYWDLTQDPPKEISSASTHTGSVNGVALSPDGKLIGSASSDKTIKIWFMNAQNQMKERTSFEAHAGAVQCIAWHPTDEKTLVSGGGDGTIKMWALLDAKTLKVRSTLKGKGGAINSVAFSPSGKTLAAACADGTVRTYSIAAGGILSEKAVLEGHIMAATGVTFSPDNNTIASASADWTVRQWPSVSGPRPKDKTIKGGHLSHVYTLAFTPDEKGLTSGAYDNTARYWELGGVEAKERMPSMKADGYVYTIAVSPDSKQLVAGGNSTKLRIFDMSSGRTLHTLLGHAGTINRVAWSPDGTQVASCATDKSIRIWDPKTGMGVSAITTFETFVNSIAFSPDSKYLLSSSGYYLYDKMNQMVIKNGKYIYLDSTVRLHEAPSMKEVYRWKDETVLPSVLAFTPDSKYFFAGASDTIVRKWPTASPPKDPEIYYKDASYGVSTMSCSPDGKWLAAWGPGYQITIFDLATGKKARNFTTGEQFGNLAFAPDSRHLAVSVGTGVVLILRLEEAKK